MDLITLLEPLIAVHSSEWWIAALKKAKVPVGEVRPMKAALSAAETLARGMVQSVAHPFAGQVPLIGSPLKLGGTPIVEAKAPPLLGEHSVEVLSGLLGY